MAAVSRQIAEAVKDELNAAASDTFSLSFSAIRDYLVQTRLEDIGDLRVVVFAADQEQEPSSRQKNQRDQQIDVGIQQKLTGTEPEHVDPLVDLAEEIADYLGRRQLTNYTAAHWLSTEIITTALRSHLIAKGVYTGVVRITYRVFK